MGLRLTLVAGLLVTIAAMVLSVCSGGGELAEEPSLSSQAQRAVRLLGRGEASVRSPATKGAPLLVPATPTPGPEQTELQESDCLVEGRVLWQRGSPVAGALVRIVLRDELIEGAVGQVLTDAEGYFCLGAIRGRLYDLYVSRDGSHAVARVTRGVEAPARLDVCLVGDAGSIRVNLLGVTKLGRLEAYLLVREVGEVALPVRRVVVRQSVVQFHGLEPGCYNIAIRGDSSGRGRCFVRPGGSTAIDILLQPGASISGVVVDGESDLPIGKCEVSAVGEGAFRVETSDTGRFSLMLTGSGQHAVLFRKRGFETQALILESAGPGVEVRLRSGRTAVVKLTASVGANRPIGRTVVELRAEKPLYDRGPREGPIRHVLDVDEGGILRVHDLRSGVGYRVIATSKDGRLAGEGTLGPEADATTVAMTAAVVVQGTVHDWSGVPVSGARVAAVPDMRLGSTAAGGGSYPVAAPSHRPGHRVLATTDEGGRFSIVISQGHTVGIWACATGHAPSEIYSWSSTAEAVELTLRVARWLSGTVWDVDGRPVPDALVVVGFGHQVYERVATRSDAAGRFSVYQVPEDTALLVRGYADGLGSTEFRLLGRGSVFDLQVHLDAQPREVVVPGKSGPARAPQGR